MQEQLSQECLAYIILKKQQLQDNNALVLEQIITLGEAEGLQLPYGWIENIALNIQAHSDITQNVLRAVERECIKQQKGDFQEYVEELQNVIKFNLDFQKYLKTDGQIFFFTEYLGVLHGKSKNPLPNTNISNAVALQEQVQAISNSKRQVKLQAKQLAKNPYSGIKTKVPEPQDIIEKGIEVARKYHAKLELEVQEDMNQDEIMDGESEQHEQVEEIIQDGEPKKVEVVDSQPQEPIEPKCNKCNELIISGESKKVYEGHCAECSKSAFT
eukprot:403359869